MTKSPYDQAQAELAAARKALDEIPEHLFPNMHRIERARIARLEERCRSL